MNNGRNIGLRFIGPETAVFTVWAPLAGEVGIETNGKIHLLEKKAHGFWAVDNIGILPGQEYSVMLDGKQYADPLSLWQPKGVQGKSMAFDVNKYAWHDAGWHGIPPEEMIIYEMHAGTFTPEGTLDAAESKIGYLKELGINTIEIMPLSAFPGDRNWGYDGVFPFAVQHSYGGPAGLLRFVDACHQNDLAVMLDVVYNHLGPEGNVFPAFGPVFTDKYKTPWGQAINFDDAWCDGVRMMCVENVLMWLRDFHIDGLRLDAVHAIKDFGAKHILQEIHEHVSVLNTQSPFRHVIIIESDLNDTRFISPTDKGGYGMDATWCDEFHHAVHALITKEQRGYYSDFGDIALLEKSFNNAYVYDGLWSDHRKKIFGNTTGSLPGNKFVVFAQNHDQVGNRMLGERLSLLTDFETLKLVAGIVIFSPFIPLLFMGEEYAETNPFLYFTSHSGEELINQVRTGRRKEFEAFMDESEMPDPQDLSTFQRSKLNWDNHTDKQQYMLSFYKALIHLRKVHPLWNSTGRQNFSARVMEQGNVMMLIRRKDMQVLAAVLNFGDRPYLLPDELAGNSKILLNSADQQWGGPGKENPGHTQTMVMPHSFCVFEYST